MSGKMIRTFDAKSYTDLLVRYQPKPIANEAENDAAIALACELEHSPMRSLEEKLFLDRKSTRLNSSHRNTSRMPSSA